MISDNIIVLASPKSPISEAYRVLRTNLQFTSLDTALRTIVITSSGPGEGKSTTTVNLAVTFAQSGSKVLIIDADLRKPRLNKIFMENNKVGLTNAIMHPDQLSEFIHKTYIDRLSIMTSGPIPPNPSELLGSKKMKTVLEGLKEQFDIIFIDSPPVGILTDAQLLSSQADGVLIVTASSGVTHEALCRSKQLLENVNARILGVVLNKLDKESNGNYYHYYYSSYDEGSDGTPVIKRKKRER